MGTPAWKLNLGDVNPDEEDGFSITRARRLSAAAERPYRFGGGGVGVSAERIIGLRNFSRVWFVSRRRWFVYRGNACVDVTSFAFTVNGLRNIIVAGRLAFIFLRL